MRVFVTGASGHIGSAVVPELVDAGHEVIGLVRSDSSAAVVESMGATARQGDLHDLDGLGDAASSADAVVHLAFDHETMDSGNFAGAVATDMAVVKAIGDALVNSDKAFVGIGIAHTGDPQRDAIIAANPRTAVARAIAEYKHRGVRTMLVAIPAVTHSKRDRIGFIPRLIKLARSSGVSGYAGEGANCWPAGHALDIGHLYRLALEKAPAGTQLFAATEEGIPVRTIAEAIGRHLGLPAASIPAEDVPEHFKTLPFISLDIKMPNASTRQLLDWTPVHPGLIADLDEGHYFETD